jgi:glycosyltransferase involved in cell wall biosynthesis
MTSPDRSSPLVSVIVTTKNEERNIGNCLKSIQLQTYKPIEIIIVDNNSTDKTKEIALGFTDVVVDKGPERSAQRNHGICDLATGQYAMFIDADMILTPTLIESCVVGIQTKDVVALHIDEVILGRGLLAEVRRYERSFYSGTVIDGARFFIRKTFCNIGGFDEGLPPGPEDWDLDKRLKETGNIEIVNSIFKPTEWAMATKINELGVKHKSNRNVIYHNEDNQSIKTYLQKKIYYAPSMKAYVEKWGRNDAEIGKQLGIWYRLVWVFIENGKFKKSFAHPLLTSAMIGLRVSVALCYTCTIFMRRMRFAKSKP